MFQATQNDEYLACITQRAKENYLTWVEQFLDIIEDEISNLPTPLRLNDIGCNVGQFWKGLKRRNLPIEYYGYDIEAIYLEKAEEIFPELKDRLQPLDITGQQPTPGQIAVVSATLEHLEFLAPSLDHILTTTESLVVIRTFLGEQPDQSIYMKDRAASPYFINQYAFADFLHRIEHHGFQTEVQRDRYTDSMPKYLGQGIVRTQYVVVGKREAS